MYGTGINKDGTILDMAIEADIIQKSGAWFSYKGDKIGQGRENAKAFLASHPEIKEEVTLQIHEKLFTKEQD